MKNLSRYGKQSRISSLWWVVVFLLLMGTKLLADDFTYVTNGSTITITGYIGSNSTVNIPDALNGLPVTCIGDYAFYGCKGLDSVTIPTSVTDIGNFGFYNCTYLRNVAIPDGVTNVGVYAFSSCGLTNVVIPYSVARIGDCAFSHCSYLDTITVAAQNPVYSSANGILFNKSQSVLIQFPGGKYGDYTIPDSVTSIANRAFYYCTGLSGVTIPLNVTSIGYEAFYRSGLNSISLSSSVTNIGYGPFAYCYIDAITVNDLNPAYSSVDGVLFSKDLGTLIQFPMGKSGFYAIPGSVTNISNEAFYYCQYLNSIIIPESVLSIGRSAFYYCMGLTDITIPDNVVSIGDLAFYHCIGLANVTIPASVTNIGHGPFTDCFSLTSLTVNDLNPAYCSTNGVLFDKNLTTLIQYPIEASGSSYVIPDGVRNIGDDAFFHSKYLNSVTIPDSVTSIGNAAFYNCLGLSDLTIPNGVVSVGNQTFSHCMGLRNVVISSNVVTIGRGAFEYCYSLAGAYFYGNAPYVGPNAFFLSDAVIYYLSDSVGWGTTFAGRPTAVWYPDSDGDGIPDWWEKQYFSGSTNADPDAVCANGLNTICQAYIAGFNPVDSSAGFNVFREHDAFKWNAISGRVYSVYWTTNLLDAAGFQCIQSNVPWTKNSITNMPVEPCGYYKIDVRLEE